MIYVIQTSGKGVGYADKVMFKTFPTPEDAEKHISENTKMCSEGNKYWVKFDVVKPGDSFESYSE